jgi:hypothetical protein
MTLSENEKNRIEDFIKHITLESIGFAKPSGFSLSTSIALSIYLRINNINTSIEAGIYNNSDHFWLSLDNYPGTIIDATIKQFDSNESDSYIGKKELNKITKGYQQKSYDLIEWLNIYGIWREPIIDRAYRIHRSDEFKEKVVINSFISAAIINAEIEKMPDKIDFFDTYFFRFYFSTILEGLREKWSKNEHVVKILRDNQKDKFEKLLHKASNC